MEKGKNWSIEELTFLTENYSKKGIRFCVENMNRSKDSIESKAKRLNLVCTRIKELYSSDSIIKAVNESKNIKEVLIYLGLKPAGGNYGVINKYIKKYNVNTNHFETLVQQNERTGFKPIKKELKDVLTKNSDFSRSQLRIRLVKEGLLKDICDKCGNTGEWQGEKLSLQLDHKNGVYNDNRLENLRFLCPNCHSQTETYAGKKKGKLVVTKV